MKAAVFRKYGAPADLKIEDVEKPKPKDEEVLVRVNAASINDWDYELLHGRPFINRLGFGLFKPLSWLRRP